MAKEKISAHAKQRNKERFDGNNKDIKNTIIYGYVKEDFEGSFYDFLDYLKHKGSGGTTVKVKGEMIVIYNKRSRRAITTFRVPDKYLPIDNFLKNKEKLGEKR